jgi:hypothetical protein
MVEKRVTSLRNVVDLVSYRQVRACGTAATMSARLCRHCGAPLLDGENEDECSSSFNMSAQRARETLRRFRAD